MTKEQLITFEKRVADAFADKQIKGPVHLSGGNEDQLLEIFKDIHPEDWICTSYRNHYHALLHGVPEEKLFQAICAGHSMTLQFAEHRFFSTAIVGGQLSIAVGIAAAIKRKFCKRKVWAFCGDMAATTGAFHDTQTYAFCNELPMWFVVEDNKLSCNSPTKGAWGRKPKWGWWPSITRYYEYERVYPHVGIDKWIQF
ncbi:MAG TPA: thiamine pyrophosphate-dependent enzyme [Candidatus Binatia bacterium]|nr:thiamine pyrophosphate-dependent enzyme [Candidatus Binatia bacterium]